MDLIYTDTKRKDVGVIKDFTLDLAFGIDENDFELTVDLNNHCCEADCLVYIEGTEYGGIVDGFVVDTKDEKLTYEGRTWHGILASKIIEPDDGEDYLTVTGDANRVMEYLFARCGLDNLFVAHDGGSGILIENYSFNRYVDLYSGLVKMLGSVGGKLNFAFIQGSVVVSALPIVDYSKNEQFDNNSVEMQFEKIRNTVNHLICLGKGELAERTVAHLFVDANGSVSQIQTFFGLQEITAVYDNSNTESVEELIEDGIKRLEELASADKVQMNLTEDDVNYDVGDIVGAREIITDTTASAKITKKIVTINQGEVNIQYKVGE